MIFKNKKIAGLAAIAAVALPAAAYSATTNVNVTAEFRTALVLATTDVAFGILEFSGAPAGTDTATIAASTGAITYAGNFSGPSTGTAGNVQVTAGSDGSTVSVRCEASATLSDGTETIDFNLIQVREEGAGADSACVNLSTSSATLVLDIGGGTADEFAFGGTLDGGTVSGGFGAAVYDTANAGGSPFQVDIIYQ